MRRLVLPLLLSLATTAHAETAPAAPRVVQVTGQGEATTLPDRARLSMSVEARSTDLHQAETKVNEGTRAVLGELKGLGLKDEDISTAGYAVNPEYDWINNQQKFRAYHAVRQVEVTVRDLGKVGDVLLRATKAGINQINPPVLESSKIKDTERAALARATEDAQAQAKVVAEALGLKLGLPRTLNANSQPYNPPMPKAMMMRASADAAPEMSGNEQMGFTAGQLRATASVTAEFELLP